MISHLSGKLVSKSPTALVVECNGIGYEVNISLNTYSKIIDSEQIKIYTHLQVREDSHSIFGFFDELERSVFRLLISVSGIGANTARTMLSSMPPNKVIESIQSDNVVAIQSIKGIGAKTAQRVIIDLKDKVLNLTDDKEFNVSPNNTQREEALSALSVLGYPIKQTQRIVDSLINAEPDMPVERIIKNALNKL
ncbi:MAG: Holliday junction branch migration protein RuvA [Bacteroidota bacterium]|nr:Holliday junction branch migration protein RuvA [Bacteroidota bacterium]MEC7286601.1 Holliday junction branch migration protein RuvA [Bacteroidota bacterium]MEC7548477.1 Holliday junction branch migration protein RuvA [Bacteroidota bacterium]MEC7829647.1 Holliday junction branch migration protein RuvA [Bacteroidota bacterium]MEC8098261.1 Holliday junction branch migration protein RuvA [Bacteroidota bacterium]|tara:strand:- start:86 stop:667 length:582 start_codon:yes stop_codon:yes gene_type:complete